MVTVEMNRDIREFDPKIIGPFTKKQAKCVGIMAAYVIPLFLVLCRINLRLAIVVVGASILPPILIGWVKVRNLSFEKFLLRWLYWRIQTPRIRRYRTQPYTKKLLIDAKKREEFEKIASMSRREYKKYEKEQAIKNTVVYSKNPKYKAFK